MASLNVTSLTINYTFTRVFCSNSRIYIARLSVTLQLYMILTQCGKDGNSEQFLFSLCVGKLLCACFVLFANFTSTVFGTCECLRRSCDSILQFHWSGHIPYLETNGSNSVHQTLSLLLSRRGWRARLCLLWVPIQSFVCPAS